jgi:hypothetical protein
MTDYKKNLELFNAHQESTRKQFEFLCKSIFLIAGAALTLSINLFLSGNAPLLSCMQASVLKASWIALTTSMVGFITSFVIMIFRDYVFGERWRKVLKGESNDASGVPGMPDALMWALGILGLLSFFGGLIGLLWIASSLIKVS